MVNLVLLGPPGAGKGTQAERLVRHHDLMHISTGDLLRDAIKTGTRLGQDAKTAVDSGKLVPDEVVIGLVRECLSRTSSHRGFILDGFPRTVAQAIALERLLAELQVPLNLVIIFDIPIDLLEERITKRAEQSRAAGEPTRSDDNREVLRKRVEEFARATAALSPFYQQRQIVRHVDASADVDDVAAQIRKVLEQQSKPFRTLDLAQRRSESGF